jgi:branched-chain amino acid transport system permease protein
VFQIALAGLTVGTIYALVALGFVVIFRATGMINFAQGDMTTAGAFVGFWAVDTLHLPILLAWVVATCGLGVLGALAYVIIFRPLRRRSLVAVAIATLGFALVLRGLLVVAFGQNPTSLASPAGNGVVHIGSAVISGQDILVLGVTAVLISIQAYVFRSTFLGKSLRAIAEDGEVAQLLGLRSERLLLGAVVYGSMLAGLAGVMLAPLLSVSVSLGWSLGLTAFAGAIIGGFGSMSGALIGGLVVGLAGEFASRYLPGDYADSVVFGLVVIVLLLRPSGILSMIPGQKV